MQDFILKVLLGVFACIGFVHIVAWGAVWWGSRKFRGVRVFPIGGADRDTGRQMSAMYACLQWEANPSHQHYVLYDAGLDEQGVKDCEILAQGAGVSFVRNMAELEDFLKTV